MEEKIVKKKQDQIVVKKKVYISPMLIIYGKLSELTAGGSPDINEPGSSTATNYYLKRP